MPAAGTVGGMAASDPSAVLGTAHAQIGRELRDAAVRVRRSWRVVLQATVAASLALAVATRLGHGSAYFAPIAAISTVATSLTQRLRRTGELVVGNAVGILLADLLVARIGTGPVQLAVLVAMALVTAIAVGGGPILLMQASSSAILIATLTPPTPDRPWSTGRVVDALIGGAIGLAAAALVMPADPGRMVRQGTAPLLTTLADGYGRVGSALAERDAAAAQAVLTGLRDSPAVADFQSGLAATRETVRLSPWYWRQRAMVASYGLAGFHLDYALRNLRVLARQSSLCLSRGDDVPEDVARALGDLAWATRRLSAVLADEADPAPVRERLLSAVRRTLVGATGPELRGPYVASLRAQVRLSASDLLEATGLSPEQTRDAIRSLTP